MFEVNIKHLSYKKLKVIEDLHFVVDGSLVLCGNNGSGKTSVLKACGGQVKCSSLFLLDNKKIKKSDLRLISSLSIVEENKINKELSIAELINEVSKNSSYNEKKLNLLIEKLKLSEIKNTKINKLSSGEFDRLVISLTLAKKAKLYLLDEPTTHLNLDFKNLVIDIIKDLSKESDILLTTNDEVVVSKMNNLNLNNYEKVKLKKGKYPKDKFHNVKNKKSVSLYKKKKVNLIQSILFALILPLFFVIGLFQNSLTNRIYIPDLIKNKSPHDIFALVEKPDIYRPLLYKDIINMHGVDNTHLFYNILSKKENGIALSNLKYEFIENKIIALDTTYITNTTKLTIALRTKTNDEKVKDDGFYMSSKLAELIINSTFGKMYGITKEKISNFVILNEKIKGIFESETIDIVASSDYYVSHFNSTYKYYKYQSPILFSLTGEEIKDIKSDEAIVPYSNRELEKVSLETIDGYKEFKVVGYHKETNENVYLGSSNNCLLSNYLFTSGIIKRQCRYSNEFSHILLRFTNRKVNQRIDDLYDIKSCYEIDKEQYLNDIKKDFQIGLSVILSSFICLLAIEVTFLILRFKENELYYRLKVADGYNKHFQALKNENYLVLTFILGLIGYGFSVSKAIDQSAIFSPLISIVLLFIINIVILIIKFIVMEILIKKYPFKKLESSDKHD